MRRRVRDGCDPAHHRIATKQNSGAPCCTTESPSADSAIGNRYSGYTSPRPSPPACRSGACHRRAWPAELTVQHTPTRDPSGRSDTSGDHDCISLGSQASTSTAPGRIRPHPLNPKDSADSRSFETDTYDVTMSARPGAKNAKAILGVVIGYPLDEAPPKL